MSSTKTTIKRCGVDPMWERPKRPSVSRSTRPEQNSIRVRLPSYGSSTSADLSVASLTSPVKVR